MPDTSNTIVEGLWDTNVSEKDYVSADKYQEHLFEQYKLYVEMADRISSRRALANAFFLTANTFLLGGVGYLYGQNLTFENRWFLILLLVAVLTLCYSWWRLIKSYRQLNTAKFKVIGEFEKKLPSSPYWRAEWKALGEGKIPSLYMPLTRVENIVPGIFAILYIVGISFLVFR